MSMLVWISGELSMKVRLNKTTWRALGGIVASGVLVVSFQNCGKAGFDSSLDDSLATGSSDAALSAKYGSSTGALVSSIPFAFDAGFDQITYNSCAGSTVTGQAGYYSIKAGAYNTMGLKLNSNFFSYVDTKFKPVYGNDSISTDQYTQYLGDSPANKGVVANLSIRSKADLYNVYSSSNTVTMGTDVVGLVSKLTDAGVTTTLAATKNAGYNSFFPFSTDSRTLEGTITMNSTLGVAEGLRRALNGGDGLLSLTYLQDSSDPNTILPAASARPVKTAYGRGYTLNFTQPSTGNNISGKILPLNIVSAITEIDMSTNQATGNGWNCNRRYIVVRKQDQATYCPTLTNAQLGDANIRNELAIARRQLRSDQWDINPTVPCVVPKGVSCYDETYVNNAPPGVNYFPGGDPTATPGSPESNGECYNATLPQGSYATSTIPTKLCANYITICTRN